MKARAAVIAELRERNAYQLASDADVATPDNQESPGARFLVRVRDDVLEAAEDTTVTADWDDMGHEMADALVPIYTHDLMLTYVDLAAYQEDVSEYVSGMSGDEITGEKLASIALYEIARRLIVTLSEQIEETDGGES